MQLVPELGPWSAFLPERLESLEHLTAHLTDVERVSFRSLLVGALCAQVDGESWESAVASTVERFNTWSRASQKNAADDDLI